MPRDFEISRPLLSNGRPGTCLLALMMLLANVAPSAAQVLFRERTLWSDTGMKSLASSSC